MKILQVYNINIKVKATFYDNYNVLNNMHLYDLMLGDKPG